MSRVPERQRGRPALPPADTIPPEQQRSWRSLLFAALVLACAAVSIVAIARPPDRTPTQAGREDVPGAPARAPGVRALTWTGPSGPLVAHQFVAGPDHTVYTGSPAGIYRSTDQGTTWTAFGHGFPAPNVDSWGLALVHGPARETGAGRTSAAPLDLLATAIDGYVYRVPLAGGRWVRAPHPIGSAAYTVLALPRPGLVLAGSDTGIYRSADAGHSWTRVVHLTAGDVSALTRDARSGRIYAGVTGAAQTLFQSDDDGRTWQVPPGRLPPAGVEGLLVSGGRVYAGVMQTSGRDPVWSSAPSSRSGHGFVPRAAGLPSSNIHGMDLAAGIDRGRQVLVVGTMGAGVFISTGGASWRRLGPVPGDGVITALSILPGRNRERATVLAGTSMGVYRLRLSPG